MSHGWIGVDLDGTLAFYDIWRGLEHIGPPVPLMVGRVKEWLSNGITVKIFTARASVPECTPHIQAWCKEHIGVVLEITNVKDFGMIALYDDRAYRIIENTGKIYGN
jgi:hypothetical protein